MYVIFDLCVWSYIMLFSHRLIPILSLICFCGATKLPVKVDVKPHPKDKMRLREIELFTPTRIRNTFSDNNFQDYRSRRSFNIEEDLTGVFENPIYKISAFGEDFQVSLEPDSGLVAPAFTSSYQYLNTSLPHLANQQLRKCFYKGSVLNKPGSQAAFSICGALTGSIYTGDYLYSIRPSASISRNSHQHVIERLSVTGAHPGYDQRPQCGLNNAQPKPKNKQTFVNSPFMGTKEKVVKLNEDSVDMKTTHQFVVDFENPNVYSAKSRQKRDFLSRQRYIETLVVADTSMAEEHGDDLEHYILSIMMVANRVFSHPSLGSALTLSIVKILVVDDKSSNLTISTSAARTLHEFCAWQKRHNVPDDSDPEHADLAILLTRKDLCGDSCDTLGMAEVGTMCSSLHSCAIVQDDGLSAAYTVAHEVGHVLNMMHDDNRLCRYNFVDIDPTTHIMSSTMTQVDSKQPWSPCSRQAVLNYLQEGRGNCLLDRPSNPKIFPHDLPGEMYNANTQCEMAFGKGAVECPYMIECGRLWCQIPSAHRSESCHTRNYPRADGTFCSPGKKCWQGKCIQPTNMQPINGNWGSWSQYGSCSRSCGGGIQMASRQCNNPTPQNGGKYCMGDRIIFNSCNIHQCPNVNGRGSGSFRSEQCAAFNGQNIPLLGDRTFTTWTPKYHDIAARDRCKLICQSQQTGAYITLGDRVVDGTRCGPDTSNLCVHGRCMQAGCDGILASKARFNKCGVCNGHKSTCKRVRGKYNNKNLGYNDVITFPVGAASIKVIQKGKRTTDGMYLALQNSRGEYILNGALTLSTIHLDIPVNGSIFEYSGATVSTEVIHSHLPLKEPITLQVLSLNPRSSPRIKYRYYLSRPKRTRKIPRPRNHAITTPTKAATKYLPRWVTSSWKKCKAYANQKCGSGWKTRLVRCRSGKRGKRPSKGCNQKERPFKRLPCFIQNCPTATSRGLPSVQHSFGDPTLINRHNDLHSKPEWHSGRWGQCSTSCGLGTKMRQVKCQTRSRHVYGNSKCDPGRKPSQAHGCILRECPKTKVHLQA